MEYGGARIYIIDEASAIESRTERLIRLAREYAAEVDVPLPKKLSIARGEHGKPYFENAPWLHFSVSHSGGLWVCALCRCEVGIDIEQYSARDYLSLAGRFFHPDETEYTERGGISGGRLFARFTPIPVQKGYALTLCRWDDE